MRPPADSPSSNRARRHAANRRGEALRNVRGSHGAFAFCESAFHVDAGASPMIVGTKQAPVAAVIESNPLHLDPIRLLLVDDDPAIIRACGRNLARHGVTVETATNGKEAVERAKGASFDVIVSDISMPQMTGLEFLRAVRAHDLDVPVILMTGAPDVESAIRAVEWGAFRYLTKPVADQELWETIQRAARFHKLARVKSEALALPGQGGERIGEQAALEVRFASSVDLMWMAFQPIVSWRQRRTFGYEALLRSDEPSMRTPVDILDAAERLGRLPELGRTVRARVAAEAAAPGAAATKLFVNLHSADLNDEELYAADSPLSRIAARVVLEVTERASLCGVKGVAACVARLKALGFQIAIDDLGAGYAGLSSFTQLEPAVAKLDMSLVRGVDADSRRQSIVRSMTRLCDELGIRVVAEGVETAAERDMLAQLGCDLLQGYLFGKPQKGFQAPRW
jgi:EAL domain-containing protein (putative c-di-GMP-specific phosphodiesterase class I)